MENPKENGITGGAVFGVEISSRNKRYGSVN
jgi:hypothetical protein